MKWSRLDLNYTSIPPIHIDQIDTSLLSFHYFISKYRLPLPGALISAILRLSTLVSVYVNFLE